MGMCSARQRQRCFVFLHAKADMECSAQSTIQTKHDHPLGVGHDIPMQQPLTRKCVNSVRDYRRLNVDECVCKSFGVGHIFQRIKVNAWRRYFSFLKTRMTSVLVFILTNRKFISVFWMLYLLRQRQTSIGRPNRTSVCPPMAMANILHN